MRQTAALQALPTGPPNNGGPINLLNPDDAARRRQGLANYTCRASGAWLNGNPSMWRTMMNNALFCMSFNLRNMFDLRGSRTHCICGAPLDCLWDHTRVCPKTTVRNKANNPAHATVTHSLRRGLEVGRNDGLYSLVPGEPFMNDFLQRRDPQQIDQDDDSRPARRADIALTSFDTNITTLIDVTVASHNSQSAAADYTVGRAADTRATDKRRRYDREYFTNNPTAKLVIFAVESSGAVHREAHQFLKEHARLVDPSNHGRKLGQLLTSLSVSIQAARARSITTARDLLSLDGAPITPYTNGPLPTVPPPVSTAPTLYPRHHAVTPLPPRPLLLLDNLVYNAPWTNNANANPSGMTVPPAISSRDNIGDLHNADVARAIPTLRSTSSVDNSHHLHNRNGSSNSIHQNVQPTINNADYRYDHYSSNGNNQTAYHSATNRSTAHTHHDPRVIHYASTRSIPFSSNSGASNNNNHNRNAYQPNHPYNRVNTTHTSPISNHTVSDSSTSIHAHHNSPTINIIPINSNYQHRPPILHLSTNSHHRTAVIPVVNNNTYRGTSAAHTTNAAAPNSNNNINPNSGYNVINSNNNSNDTSTNDNNMAIPTTATTDTINNTFTTNNNHDNNNTFTTTNNNYAATNHHHNTGAIAYISAPTTTSNHHNYRHNIPYDIGNNNNNNNIHILATTSHGTHNAANTTENHATSNETSNNSSTSSNNTYHAIPCTGVLPHDGTGAVIDTAVSESARNASGGPTHEDSII